MMKSGMLFIIAAILAVVFSSTVSAISATGTLYQGKFTSEKWLFEDAQNLKSNPHELQRFKSSRISFIVALKLRNTDQMHSEFLDVSNPKSKKYGKFYSPESLQSSFGPSAEAREKVMTFFGRIPGAHLEIGEYGDLLEVTAAISDIEGYLQTELGFVTHRNAKENHLLSDKKSIRAMSNLHIPEFIAEYVSFVSLNTPVTHAKPRGTRTAKEQERLVNEKKMKEQVGSADASNAVRTINGNEEAIVRFPVYCADGSLNQQSPPCNTFPAADQPRFTFTFTEHANNPSNPFLLATEPTVYTVPASGAYCYNVFTTNTCSGNDGRNCTCLAKLSPLPKYTQLLVNVTSTYDNANGAVRPLGQSSYFALTDVATARFLSDLYNIPQGIRVNHGSNQSVAEFYEEFYSNTDLTKFLVLSGLPNATIPPANVYGDLPNDYADPGGEAQLDIEYIMALAPGAETYFYSMADYNPYDIVNQTNEGFLAYLQTVDGQEYPPLVHSLSYGDIESDIFNASNPGAVEYATRCDQEFQQMGLRGLSVLFSSGDDGIGSALIREDPDLACSQSWPEWPASSPYVTAVGATQLTDKYLPVCGMNYAPPAAIPQMPQIQQLVAECSGVGETVCTSVMGGVITSGGGFSDVYNRSYYAPWQETVVNAYLSQANAALGEYPPTNIGYFNPYGRGYPDVSTYGSNYFIYLNNLITRESGTSASAPVFAAMVTLWNDIRLAYNMPPMGFIAPFLYDIYATHPDAFNDVVTGNNACGVGGTLTSTTCCEYSYSAVSGWDAVTGLGSPNFEIISNLVLNAASPFPNLAAYPNGNTVTISDDDDEVKSEADASLAIGITALALAVFTCLGGFYFFYSKKSDTLLG